MGKKSDEGTEGGRKNDLARGTHYYADPDELIIIGIDTDHKSREEHYLYDPRIHMPIPESEVRNIEHFGVKEAGQVTRFKGKLKLRKGHPLGEEVTNPLLVVNCRGRVRKARIVKQRQIERGEETIKVPVTIEVGDEAHLFSLSRALNIHKNDGPMTTAKNVQYLLSMGRSIQQAADTFGVSEQTIRNYQSFLELHKEVADAMEKDEISATVALQLVGLSQDEQKEVLADLKTEAKETGKKVTVERAKRKVAERQGKQTKTPKDRIDAGKNLLTKFALMPAGEKTKEKMLETMERLARVLTGMGLDKLAATDEE